MLIDKVVEVSTLCLKTQVNHVLQSRKYINNLAKKSVCWYKRLSRRQKSNLRRSCGVGGMGVVFGLVVLLNADKGLGVPVMINNELVGVVAYGTEIEESQEVQVASPVVYDSKDTIVLTTEDIQQAQREIAMLNELVEKEKAEEEAKLVEVGLGAAEPESLIDEEILDSPDSQVSLLMDMPSAVSAKEPNSSVDLLNAPEKQEKRLAYAVYIDDEYIGAVDDITVIEDTLMLLKLPYVDTEDLISLEFDKQVTYDKQIELGEGMLTDPEAVVDKLLSTEGVARYYEVVPGDCPSIIADKLNISLDTLYACPATLNGDTISSLADDCRVGVQIQYAGVRKFIHVLITKETTYTDMLSYETEVYEDDTLYKGTTVVDVAGEYGEALRTCKETIEDDVIIASETLSFAVTKNPVTEVVRVGTRETVTEVNTHSWAGGSGAYFWPVGDNQGYISAYVGDYRGHKGIDIAAPYGTPVYAATSGTVKKAVFSGWGSGYGRHVLIANDDGYSCMYGHFSYVAEGIDEGVYVTKGQLIGYVGSTGDSTGNHLHFEVRNGSSYLNPTNYVSK